MFSGIRRRVTYANVAVTVAVVFAMSGGAYAASRYVITSTKQISPKVLKALQGKAGAAGANGTNGTNGSNGAPGEKGAPGPQGPEGKAGTNGTPGTSVTNTAVPVGVSKCEERGGAEFKAGAGSATYACNGQTGFTETLPGGKTETGAWFAESGASKVIHFAVSFAIPLAAPIATAEAHFVTAEQVAKNEIPAGCGGTPVEPKADPGNLCLFEGGASGGFSEGIGFIQHPGVSETGAGTTGAVVTHQTAGENEGYDGTWAVSAG